MRTADHVRLAGLAAALTADESHLRAMLVTTVTVGAALLIAAAVLPAAPQQLAGVVFVDGLPAAGAVVTLHGSASSQGTADAAGAFGLQVVPGVYTVTVVWPGRLDRRFADPAASGLQIVVRRGDRQLPAIQLPTAAAPTSVAHR